jgi:hypothetical protein
MTERNVLVVDWSANSKPKTGADSIWIGDAYGNRVNPSTRVEAIEFLKKLISKEGNEKKWLIAFDFSFGVPWWTGRKGGGGVQFWKTVHKCFPKSRPEYSDLKNQAANLRWQVANDLNCNVFKKKKFWGCPEDLEHRFDSLSSTKGNREEASEMRIADKSATGSKSPWQLRGNGAVGSQMLMGIFHLQQWRTHSDWKDQISVWPFDKSRKRIVFSETFPSDISFKKLFGDINSRSCGLVKDAVQVTSVARCIQDALHESDAELLSLSNKQKERSEGKILVMQQKKTPEGETTQLPSREINNLILGKSTQVKKWTRLLGSASEKIKNSSEP